MGFTHLRGSLAKNISDITKGGGCPEPKSPMINFNVLRYFSKVIRGQDLFYNSGDGDFPNVYNSVAGDGGAAGCSNITGTRLAHIDSPYGSPIINMNLNAGIPYNDTEDQNDFYGNRSYLNICNQFEIVAATHSEGSTCNIEIQDTTTEKDEEGFYIYKLFKPNDTRNIVLAGETEPTSKTAHLMEFVFLHGEIPKCKKGNVYLEIEDFEIEGDVSKDNFIYFYYWEGDKKLNLKDSLYHERDTVIDKTNFLSTDNENIPIKICKLSDLQGNGLDKKLIVWLHKNKARGEKYYFNLLIGLKPEQLRSDYLQRGAEEVRTGTPDIPTSEIIFKFKNAKVKVSKQKNLTINSMPIPYPNYGYIGLYDSEANFRAEYKQINLDIVALQSNGKSVDVFPDSNVVGFGLPDGGTDTGFEWILWNGATSDLIYNEALGSAYIDGVASRVKALIFHKCAETLSESKQYKLKLPPFSDLCSMRMDYSYTTCEGHDNPTLDREDTSNGGVYKLRIYAANNLTSSSGQRYPNLKTWVDSFILIDELEYSEFSQNIVDYNSGEPKYYYEGPFEGACHPVQYLTDVLYGDADEISARRNRAISIDVDGALIAGFDGDLCFVATLEKDGEDIRSATYSKAVGETGDAYPVGLSHWQRFSGYDVGVILHYDEYSIIEPNPELGLAGINWWRNYDSMLYMPPQIIDKTDIAEPENYSS